MAKLVEKYYGEEHKREDGAIGEARRPATTPHQSTPYERQQKCRVYLDLDAGYFR
jgi:hypothetical protein